MRDGTRLFTAIYAPRDTTRTYPILLTRTPYSVGPYGNNAFPASLGPWSGFQDPAYIFVRQDVRGRYMSEGYHQFMTPHLSVKQNARDVDESSDTYDTIDWLIKNVPRNSGRVGTFGTSAPGFFVVAGMIDAHPAHRAAYASAPMIDWWLGDDRHHNGAFTLAQTFNFISGFDQPRSGPTTQYPPRPDFGTQDGFLFHLNAGPLSQYSQSVLGGRVAFWDSIAAHPDYDEFWQRRAIWRNVSNIRPAVLTVGGWYDAEDRFGFLQLNSMLRALSPQTQHTLVIGPWTHGSWGGGEGNVLGPLSFGSATARYFRDSIGLPFLSCALKDRCGAPPPRVSAFATGSNRWHTFDAWPPRNATPRPLYLRENGVLSFEPPTGEGADWYTSFPARPVPYTQALSFGYWREYPVEDQRFASRRPDVLVYQTAPLTEDLTIAGPIEVTLHAATTGTDADFIVKVIDVYPSNSPAQHPNGPRMDAYQQLVHGNAFRMRWRRSFERPQPMIATTPDSVTFALEDVFHTFRRGHRLMVHVQSTWFPLIDRNPQTFVPNIYAAKPADFQAHLMTVFRAANRPSRLGIPVLR
jgi:putative CocE/NonD family hydrolase